MLDRNDLPIGFSMSLAQDMEAMTAFVEIGEQKQKELMDYIKDSKTGDEARARTDNVLRQLHDKVY